MGKLISSSAVIDDDWVRLEDEEPLQCRRRLMVSAARLRRDWEVFEQISCELGVELEVSEQVEDLSDYLDRLDLIVLKFDVFADGRAFSQARLLRERLNYTGSLRATGEVLRDQLAFMQRCGFDQFELADSEDLVLALNAFTDISQAYQPDATIQASYR